MPLRLFKNLILFTYQDLTWSEVTWPVEMDSFHQRKFRGCSLITLAWLGHMKWKSGTLSFWYAFPPSFVVVCQVITWLCHVTWRNDSVSSWYILPLCLLIVAFVIVAYDVFDLSTDHVIKIHVIGKLGTIWSFPQNLVYIQFPFWNFGR